MAKKDNAEVQAPPAAAGQTAEAGQSPREDTGELRVQPIFREETHDDHH